MESVYSVIPQPVPVAARAKPFRSQRHATDPTYTTFGLLGTSVVVGNAGGHGAVSLHPRRKGHGAIGKVVSEDVAPDTYLRRVEKAETTRPFYNKNQRMELPADERRRTLRGRMGRGRAGAGGGGGGVGAPAEGGDGEERAGSAPLLRAGAGVGAGGDGGASTDDRKANVPYRTDRPVMGLRSDRNFVVSNAVDAVLAVPKHPQPCVQRAVDLPTYGKAPPYLKRRAAEAAAHHAALREGQTALEAKNERFRVMPTEERQSMTDRLQARARELHRAIQTLGFALETQSQLRHREAIEKELKLVEAALARLKGPATIYVYADHM